MPTYFDSTKTFTIKFEKDLADELRKILYQKKLSFQDLFEYLAILVSVGDERVMNMVDEISKEKLNKSIEDTSQTMFKASMVKEKPLSSEDIDVIYELLNDHDPIKKS